LTDSLGSPEMQKYGERYTRTSLYSFVELDKENNIYLAYANQNLIEKYSSAGKKLLSIDRKLSFDYKDDPDTNSIENLQFPKIVSNGIALDSKDRLWVLTTKKEHRILDDVEDLLKTDTFKLEIYDSNEGILLGEIPLDHYGSNLYINNDSLYIIDTHFSMAVYEYKIIDD
ncbi:hypothetical protein ACFL6G_07615, partial [candidate division KSB1 bacterium]